MRISDWSSDVCSSDLQDAALLIGHNIIGYDCAVIEKLYSLSIPPADKLIDTVNLAKLVFSDIKATDFPLAKAWKKWKVTYDQWLDRSSDRPFPYDRTKPKEFHGHFVGMHPMQDVGYRPRHERKGAHTDKSRNGK